MRQHAYDLSNQTFAKWMGDSVKGLMVGLIFSVLFNVFFFVLSPVVNGVSRHIEHSSDQFGLELTQDNHSAATAFVKLQQENLGNPRPGLLYKLWRASHPPLAERIDYCNAYRPWETGDPLRFEKLFSEPTPGP